jgi:hypothetical protein
MLLRFAQSSWYWAAALVAAVALGAFFAPALGPGVGSGVTSESVSVSKKLKLEVAPVSAAHSAARAQNASGVAFPQVPNGAQPRRLARTAAVSLIVPDVARALGALSAIVRASGGDVVKLDDERPATPADRHTADLTLSVPERRFDATLSALSRLGGVRSQTVAAEDLGDQIVDSGARLRNLRRTEGDMLKIMDRSGKIGEVLEVETQLSSVREQIEKLDAESRALNGRVTNATLDVSLEDEAPLAAAEPSAASRLAAAWAAAWRDSRETALALVARGFVLLAFAPYWLVLLGAGARGAYLARRRFRARGVAAVRT